MSNFPKPLYLKTLTKFASHWKDVNAGSASGEPVFLKKESGGVIGPEDLDELIVVMRSSLNALQKAITSHTEARLTLDSAKRAILFRAQAISRNINWNGTDGNQIEYPSIRADWENFASSLGKMASSWEMFDEGSHGPMILAGRYGLKDFLSELENLRELVAIAVTEEDQESSSRARYEFLFTPLADIFERYPKEILRRFPARSPEVLKLPAISYRDETVAPPPNGKGEWNAPEEVGIITWTASPETRSHHYEVRYSPGDRYDADVESVIGVIRSGGPLIWKTTSAFGGRCPFSLFRIYTVLESGAERSGETITIVKPLADD